MNTLLLLFVSLISFAQLENLKHVSEKKLVALGESGHAVAGFHHWRGEISKVLIEKYGFRNVLVEEDLLSGYQIIDAIESCRKPDVDMSAVNRAFRHFDPATYQHKEFFVFYEYLCDWNKRHPADPVRLSGIDVWSNYWDLRKYLELKILPLEIEALKRPFLEAKDQCFLWSINATAEYPTHPDWAYYEKYQRVEPTRHAKCQAATYALTNAFSSNKALIVSKTSEADYLRMLMALDTAKARQSIRDAYTFDFATAMALRDAAQARNVRQHLALFKSEAPTVFMAHNVHVFQKMSQVLPREITTPYPWAHVTSAGEWLKSYYGDRMAVIGLGDYDLKSFRDGQYPLPTSERSLDLKLHNEGHEVALIKAPAGEWWVHNETESEGLWIRPRDQFDYYLFIDASGPATPFQAPLVTGKAE